MPPTVLSAQFMYEITLIERGATIVKWLLNVGGIVF
jgi:hypothetical protein